MYRPLALAVAASSALSVLLILPDTAGARQRPPIVEKLAQTYGLEAHRGTNNGQPAHVFFSNVAVKLVGSNTWLDAK